MSKMYIEIDVTDTVNTFIIGAYLVILDWTCFRNMLAPLYSHISNVGA